MPPFLPGIPKAASRILSPSFIPNGTFTENVLTPPLYPFIAIFFSVPKKASSKDISKLVSMSDPFTGFCLVLVFSSLEVFALFESS
ncbi:hypothetical protein D3C73_1425170 [compost metagenome]